MPRIAEIRMAVHENKLSDPTTVTAELTLWFIEKCGIWVWEEDGRIEGFSAGDIRDGSIWALFVDPDHEGRGIGRALLRSACSALRDAGFRAASLSTEAGTRAERFYAKAGWTADGRNAKGEIIFRSDLV